MLSFAVDAATGQTIALLITFIGIGILVNVLIIYIIAQVMLERKQNQKRQRSFEL
jgi:phage shock protein PspC (stress-responsive transcriptional regulator)